MTRSANAFEGRAPNLRQGEPQHDLALGVEVASRDEAELVVEAEGVALALDASGDELGASVRTDEVDDLFDGPLAVSLAVVRQVDEQLSEEDGLSVCGGSGAMSQATMTKPTGRSPA